MSYFPWYFYHRRKNENVSYRLVYLNTWHLLVVLFGGGGVIDPIGGKPLLETIYHWRWGLTVHTVTSLSACSCCFLCADVM